MVKEDKDVISEFNEYVNMTASELEKWLKSEDSSSAGQSKDGSEGGESVGQDSGHKIVEILKANPDKDPEKYTEEQIQHMRKVASYCKRHLAQESSGNNEKDAEDVKKTKSYISLKNWGHDFLKAQGQSSGSANGGSKSGSKKKKEEEEDKEEEKDDGGEEEEEEEGKKAGDKRKKSDGQDGSNKKRETGSKTRSSDKNASEDEDEKNGGDNKNGAAEEEKEGEENGEKTNAKGGAKNGPEKGETVSWNWGSGNPQGKVLDVKEEKATITTKRGNEVSRDGDPEDPAVILDAGKSKAIKSAHELN